MAILIVSVSSMGYLILMYLFEKTCTCYPLFQKLLSKQFNMIADFDLNVFSRDRLSFMLQSPT